MNILARVSIIAVTLPVIFMTGCREEVAPENLKVPRLYLEARSINYVAMTPTRLVMPKSDTSILVNKEPLVNEFQIINAELVKVDLGMALLLQLNEKAARSLYRATVVNAGGRIVLTINNNPVGFRRIDGVITDGNFYCFLEMKDTSLGQLVLDLKDSFTYLQRQSDPD